METNKVFVARFFCLPISTNFVGSSLKLMSTQQMEDEWNKRQKTLLRYFFFFIQIEQKFCFCFFFVISSAIFLLYYLPQLSESQSKKQNTSELCGAHAYNQFSWNNKHNYWSRNWPIEYRNASETHRHCSCPKHFHCFSSYRVHFGLCSAVRIAFYFCLACSYISVSMSVSGVCIDLVNN